MVYPAACCVRNFLSALFTNNLACCVRNLLGLCFTHPATLGARNFTSSSLRNLLARCVGNFTVTDLRNHSSATNSLLYGARYPAFAADGLRRAGAADGFVATWIAWIWNTLLNHWAGNCLRVVFPSARFNRNRLGFCDWLHHCVT